MPDPNVSAIPNLFRAVGPENLNAAGFVKKGQLITFQYSRWRNDPFPLLLITDVIPNVRLRGINLHYMTFPFIKNLLRLGTNNPYFSYQTIKPDAYIVGAFRTYKFQAVRTIKVLDSNFILTIMATARTFDPTQIHAIRKAVQDQIRQVTQVGASQLSNQSNQTSNGPQNSGQQNQVSNGVGEIS